MRNNLKEVKDKHIFRLFLRFLEIKKELKEKYPVHFISFPSWYTFESLVKIEDLIYFLQLRDEAIRIEHIIYKIEHRRFVKYVKGGATYYYTPIKKKERRKKLRKCRLRPIAYYKLLCDEEMLELSVFDDSST